MVFMALILGANVAIWSLPDAGGVSPAAKVQG